ncbi:MAG TPA: reverse transcriptase-like protein [Candidatus Acidoferrales bacterium]|nr:reverse transcriptase-like protein [Candidatus Acidoferrales bacterium]
MTKRTPKPAPPLSARLFVESHPAPPAGVHVAHIDGASRGNPGPAAYAVILRGPDGSTLAEIGKRIGRETNNVAEYYGLIAALDYAANHGIRALRIRSDSELLVRQIQGQYKVKNAALKPLFERARKLTRALEYFAIEHVPREANRDADALANLALDRIGSPMSGQPQSLSGAVHASTTPRRVLARYVGGTLIPEQPLNIPEGTSVEIMIRNPKNI